MRHFLTAAAIALIAGPALAQDDVRAEAKTMMVEELTSQDLPPEVADVVSDCALSQMDEALMSDLIAAEDDEARADVMDQIASPADFEACVETGLADLG